MVIISDPEESGTDTLRIPPQEVFGIKEVELAVGDAESVWSVTFDKALDGSASTDWISTRA